jgi:copper chaperone NosL
LIETIEVILLQKKSRILFGIAVLLLLILYFSPVWKIGLNAPQYPEGIGLRIWINKITGENKHDLDNINRLNHYIGMKEITPEEIPELKLIPYIIGILILTGMVGIFTKKRLFFYIWLFIFLTITVIGIVDFYKWEYDYGHNLNPDAPIKVPGMTYQPPLFGTKKLLNITASSYPAIGGWFALLSLSIGVIIFLIEKNIGPWRKNSVLKTSGFFLIIFISTTQFLLQGCSAGPSPIKYGQDMCAHCQMIISDQRFGTELVTSKGKIYKYDSVECLISDYLKMSGSEKEIHSLWVTDFNNPTVLINAKSAIYLHSSKLRSPMGMGLSAFSDEAEADEMKNKFTGTILPWNRTLTLLGESEFSKPKVK